MGRAIQRNYLLFGVAVCATVVVGVCSFAIVQMISIRSTSEPQAQTTDPKSNRYTSISILEKASHEHSGASELRPPSDLIDRARHETLFRKTSDTHAVRALPTPARVAQSGPPEEMKRKTESRKQKEVVVSVQPVIARPEPKLTAREEPQIVSPASRDLQHRGARNLRELLDLIWNGPHRLQRSTGQPSQDREAR
jgi:cytoskeletal protein RodZ